MRTLDLTPNIDVELEQPSELYHSPDTEYDISYDPEELLEPIVGKYKSPKEVPNMYNNIDHTGLIEKKKRLQEINRKKYELKRNEQRKEQRRLKAIRSKVTITPKEFNDLLTLAEKKFGDKIPVELTISPIDPSNKRMVPTEILEALRQAEGKEVKVVGEILANKSAMVNRFTSGGYDTRFLFKINGEMYFRFFPQSIQIKKNRVVPLKWLNINIGIVSSIKIGGSTAVKVVGNTFESVAFYRFLESLKRSDSDISLIESIKLGYRALMNS